MTTDELAKLSPDEKRMKIAEACGIAEQNECPSCHLYRGQGHASFCHYLPDYLNSLDAMHEAEKTLTAWQCKWFEQHLSQCVFRSATDADWTNEFGGNANTKIWHATAAHRADAFLLTL